MPKICGQSCAQPCKPIRTTAVQQKVIYYPSASVTRKPASGFGVVGTVAFTMAFLGNILWEGAVRTLDALGAWWGS